MNTPLGMAVGNSLEVILNFEKINHMIMGKKLPKGNPTELETIYLGPPPL